MNGELELMEMKDERTLLGKWLKILLYVGLVSFGNTLLGLLPFGNSIVRLIGLALNGMCVYTMFQLSPACNRYRTVAIMKAVLLVSGIFSVGMLALVFAVCSIVADYQEYAGHGEVVAPMDEKLAGKWNFLFWLELIIGLISAVVTGAGTVIGAVSGMEGTAMAEILTVVATGIELFTRVIYLAYLSRTAKLFVE